MLAVSIDGVFYLPCYDHNGNIVAYVSEAGDIAAQFVYDPYGHVIEQYGAQASQFSFGFSTKVHDREISLVSYQRRFYSPDLGRWLNRDPLEEQGGENLYEFSGNGPPLYFDGLGLSFWDDLIDSAKVAVGLCTAISGASLAGATSWTGGGAVAGAALLVLGADQMYEGLNSIRSRMMGGPATDASFVKQIISETSTRLTGQQGSGMEQGLLETYTAIQMASSCYSGIVTAKSTIKALSLTRVPAHTEIVPVLQKSTIHWELELKASYWKVNGVEDAVSGAFSLIFQGISVFEHEDTKESGE